MNMKKEKNKRWLCLLVGISLVAGLTACVDETMISSAGEGRSVVVDAEINSLQPVTNITRAAVEENTYDRTTFVTGDKIRITRTQSGKNTATDYQLAQSDGWTTSGTALTLLAGASYQAVYPAGNDAGIQYDQSTKENYIKSNRLVSAAIASPETELLKFAFGHQNTKLTLVFQPKVAGALPSDFTFQVSAPGLQTGGTKAEIIKLFKSDNMTWCGIIYPKGAATSITVTMTYNQVAYSSTFDCEMKAGTHYKYTLSLRNDILVPEVNQILGWSNENIYTGPLN